MSRYGTLTAASAASRTTGLALKAMPRPARAEHVEVVGAVADRHGLAHRDARRRAANRSSASALPARSTTGPTSRAGQPAVDDLEGVGAGVVDAELGGEVVGDLGEPAGDDARSGSRAA